MIVKLREGDIINSEDTIIDVEDPGKYSVFDIANWFLTKGPHSFAANNNEEKNTRKIKRFMILFYGYFLPAGFAMPAFNLVVNQILDN